MGTAGRGGRVERLCVGEREVVRRATQKRLSWHSIDRWVSSRDRHRAPHGHVLRIGSVGSATAQRANAGRADGRGCGQRRRPAETGLGGGKEPDYQEL